MKPLEIVQKFREILLSASDEVELKEQEVEDLEVVSEELQEEVKEEAKEETEAKEEVEAMEQVSMEDFNKLKAEVASLKAMVSKSMESKEEEMEVPSELEAEKLSAEPIVHTPEEKTELKLNLFSQQREESMLERIFSKINK